MIPLRLRELDETFVVRGDRSTLVTGVAVDSRAVQRGDLFVAVRGSRLDGHDFVADAAMRGAAAACVEAGRGRHADLPLVEAHDARTGLRTVACAVRDRSTKRSRAAALERLESSISPGSGTFSAARGVPAA